MSCSNLHSAWAELFMRSLASAGVVDVVISPGSRSTPLALAAARLGELRCHTAVDERSAAFFALGQARVTGRPSALVCTSGTAGAHYLPAIIEASQSFVPMVAITADRPWELVDVAAPQTIDQIRLFGVYARHFAELGLPDPAPSALRAVPRIAAQAVALSLSPLPGPVHVNARFRKPLEPVPTSAPEPWQPLVDELIRRGPTRVFAPEVAPSPSALDEIAKVVARAERGLIVCGPSPLDPERRFGPAIRALARVTGFPVLAESTSGARFAGAGENVTACPAFDSLLRSPAFRRGHVPDLILEFGAPPTSQGYAELVAENPRVQRYVLAHHGYSDPAGTATALVLGDPVAAAAGIHQRLASRGPSPQSAWAASFTRADARAWALAAEVSAEPELTEAGVARAVVETCPEGSVLVIGNSTPVRDVDAWAPARSAALDVLHQRGASGIDGLVSGAAGALSATDKPVTLLLGDLSLLHDLGGLALARRADRSLVIVVVQNGGGRIFEHLPIVKSAARPDFDKYFTMPEPVGLVEAAASFGIRFARVQTPSAFAAAFGEAHAQPGATLVEAVVPPGDGAARVTRFRVELAAQLAAEPETPFAPCAPRGEGATS
jgi:2-succinyl-5-enolpyruvyl-6-hydroxy-3-cyclohexene-1-carboxylate synthase